MGFGEAPESIHSRLRFVLMAGRNGLLSRAANGDFHYAFPRRRSWVAESV